METTEGAPETPEATIARSLREDAMGEPLMDRLELVVFGVGLASTLLTLVLWDLSFTGGWALGAGIGQLSLGAIRRLVRRLFEWRLGKGLVIVALLLKTTFLLIGCWVALSVAEVSVLAFTAGYTATLTGLVLGGMLCAPRPTGEAAVEPPGRSKDLDLDEG